MSCENVVRPIQRVYMPVEMRISGKLENAKPLCDLALVGPVRKQTPCGHRLETNRIVVRAVHLVRQHDRTRKKRSEPEAVRIHFVVHKSGHRSASGCKPKFVASRTNRERAIGQTPEAVGESECPANSNVRSNVVVCVTAGARIPVNLVAMDAIAYVQPRAREAVSDTTPGAAGNLGLL